MFADLRKEINKLDGVISCKITGADSIDEIHIVSSKERKPKRIVRDIETMVLVNLDQEIDHKKISIARINTQEETDRQRVEIFSIYSEYNNPVIHIKVKINDEIVEETINGDAEEPLPLLVVKGMVDIIHTHTNFDGKIKVENVFKTGMNEEIIIVQLILHHNGFSRKRMLGAVYIEENLPLAVGKACLKALNRMIISC